VLIGAWGNHQGDAEDVDPSQHALHCGHDSERNIVVQVHHGCHPEAHCNVLGKLKVGCQPRAEFTPTKLEATEVRKGNRGVANEEGLQSGATAERVQNGLHCDISCLFQGQVYEVFGFN